MVREMRKVFLYFIVNGDPTRLTRFFPGESELRHGSSFSSSSNRSADSILQFDGSTKKKRLKTYCQHLYNYRDFDNLKILRQNYPYLGDRGLQFLP